ncbi:MAG: HAMP domain-containing histidine kinase [Deltaproteobacteria bacterium]|nr:HAMP domain-containing histidine kinase [Deltaproteobacteria bacterium]
MAKSRHADEIAWLASFPEENPNPIIEVDRSGVISYMNPAARNRIPDLADRGGDHTLLDGIESLFEELSAGVIRREVEWGDCVYEQEVHRVPGGKAIRIYMNDITERKRLEQLKDSFVSTVSHELRTPLSIIKGAVGNLRDGIVEPLSSAQSVVVEMINRNVDRLTRIINDVLDLSRLESGATSIHRQEVPVAPLLHEAITSFQRIAEERGLMLEEDVSAGLPPLDADPDLMAQVLTNLLDNALRFAKERVVVEARLVPEEKGASPVVQMTVVDDGPGIVVAERGKLFSKFHQLHRPRGGSGYKGTGLGLALCREIVTQHGGTIGVEGHEAQGSRFWFQIPGVRRKEER